jgi:hypothetical protein
MREALARFWKAQADFAQVLHEWRITCRDLADGM